MTEPQQPRPTRAAWLERVARLEPVETGMSAAELIREGRAERDRQLEETTLAERLQALPPEERPDLIVIEDPTEDADGET